MVFIWILIYSGMPYLLILGLLGVFGEEAEEVAFIYSIGMSVALVIALVLFCAIYALT